MPKKAGYGNRGMGGIPRQHKPKTYGRVGPSPGTHSPNATYGTPSPGTPSTAGKGKKGGGNPGHY